MKVAVLEAAGFERFGVAEVLPPLTPHELQAAKTQGLKCQPARKIKPMAPQHLGKTLLLAIVISQNHEPQVPMKLGRDFQDAAACWRGGDGDGRPAGVEFKFSQQQSKLQFWR